MGEMLFRFLLAGLVFGVVVTAIPLWFQVMGLPYTADVRWILLTATGGLALLYVAMGGQQQQHPRRR